MSRTLLGLSLPLFLVLPACSGDDDGTTDTMASDSTTGTSDATTDATTGTTGTTDATTGTTTGTTDATTGTTDATTGTTGAGDAMIRVMHLGVGVPAVDVFANDAEPAVVTDLDFRMGTPYLPVPAADYTFQVSLAGGTPQDAAITAGPLSLESDVMYTAVAIGDLDDSNLEILPLVADVTDLDAANIRLQITHAAPAVGQVDIWNITNPNNPSPLLENVDYKASGTVDVPPAAYDIGIDVDDDQMPDITFTADVSILPAGTFVDVFASNDNENPTGVALVALLPDGTALTIPPN